MFLLAVLAGYIGTVAGNVTSDAIHDAKIEHQQEEAKKANSIK